MTSTKYIGMDVHKESISMAVRNAVGKIVMESVIETKASIILQFIDGLRGDLQVTFEEGTSAAWLYDLLKPHVTKLVVCDPRKNASMREGNQSDKIDARRLAELLRLNHLHPVYLSAPAPIKNLRLETPLDVTVLIVICRYLTEWSLNPGRH
jgi:transposase